MKFAVGNDPVEPEREAVVEELGHEAQLSYAIVWCPVPAPWRGLAASPAGLSEFGGDSPFCSRLVGIGTLPRGAPLACVAFAMPVGDVELRSGPAVERDANLGAHDARKPGVSPNGRSTRRDGLK